MIQVVKRKGLQIRQKAEFLREDPEVPYFPEALYYVDRDDGISIWVLDQLNTFFSVPTYLLQVHLDHLSPDMSTLSQSSGERSSVEPTYA